MIVDGELYVRTGEMELALAPQVHTSTIASNADSPVINGAQADGISNQRTLSHAAYHILTATDPLEKVMGTQYNHERALCESCALLNNTD